MFDNDGSGNTAINLGFPRLNTLRVVFMRLLSDQASSYITSLSSAALYFAYLNRYIKQAPFCYKTNTMSPLSRFLYINIPSATLYQEYFSKCGKLITYDVSL